MGNAGAGVGGFIMLAVWAFLFIASIMAIFIPFWVYRIRNEIIDTNERLNKVIFLLKQTLELTINSGKNQAGKPKQQAMHEILSRSENNNSVFCPDCGEPLTDSEHRCPECGCTDIK